MAKSVVSAKEWNEKGNEEFEKGNWSKALNHYTNALNVEENNHDKRMYYRNRIATYLKLGNYEKVVEDCDNALMICCNKILYHRYQALIALERFEEAFRDAEIIISSDPNNKVIQPVATRLREIVQERRNKDIKISAKVSKMLNLAFYVYASEKEHEIAMNDLLVLACDEVGAEEIFKKEGVSKIAQLVKVEKNEEILCSAIRIVGELCKNNISRTESVMKSVGLPWFLEIMNSPSIERVNASQYSLQNILNTYSDSKPDEALCAAHKKEIDTILLCLSYNITSITLTGLARDAIIEFIMRNIHCVTKLDWAKRFVELRGVQKLMEVAGEMEEYNSESLLRITSTTQTITSACLAKIYENVYYDDKTTFINAIDEFIEDKLHSPGIESKVRVRIVVAITTLLSGPLDVGNAVVAKERILDMIFVMAETDDVLQQTVALQCIVAAVTRKDKVDAIINQGVNTLKKLCQSKDDSIRVRALVAFCKLGNSGDSDATIGPFAEGVIMELTNACLRLWDDPKIGNMAVKGTSYLTFNTKVKQEFIENVNYIDYLLDMTETETGDQFLFDVLTTLVNLCNAYDEQEPEISKFVKYHFPEKSDKLDDYFERSLGDLINKGVISYLVDFAKRDNQNCKELIARVFNAICSEQKLREIFVDEGGTKALLSLALDGTVKGKKQASLALVRLALTKPEVLLPGQLLTEVIVKPIVNLMNLECSVKENCQTLTALCNLAEVNDSMREHIFKEGVFQKIEAFVYEEDCLLKLASANLINILLLSREVAIQCFEQDNSRVEYHLMLLYKNENKDIKFAAAAALVKLMVANKEACKKVFDSNFWLEFLRSLLTNPSNNIQEMGVIFVLSMIRSMEDFAAKLIETDIIELLKSLSKNDNKKIKELTSIALEAVAERFSSEALIAMIKWERDAACRLGQLDLLNRLEIKLWIYDTKNLVPLNIYSEFGRILTGR
ncbi:protein unc-45 homolog B-like isoform X1 [Temnothorax americanus]